MKHGISNVCAILFLVFLLFTCKRNQNSDVIAPNQEIVFVTNFIDSLKIKWNWCYESISFDEIKKSQNGQLYRLDTCEQLDNLNSRLFIVNSFCHEGGNLLLIYAKKNMKIYPIPLTSWEEHQSASSDKKHPDLLKTLSKYKNGDLFGLEIYLNEIKISYYDLSDYDIDLIFSRYISGKLGISLNYVRNNIVECSTSGIDYLEKIVSNDPSIIYCKAYKSNLNYHMLIIKKAPENVFMTINPYRVLYYTL